MNEKELQQAFLQFLAQKSGAKNQKELEQYVQSLGEEGLKQAYEEFTQYMQKQTKKAAHGTKLNYFRELKNQCPEGYEVVYYSKGGKNLGCGCKKKKGGEIQESNLSWKESFKNRKMQFGSKMMQLTEANKKRKAEEKKKKDLEDKWRRGTIIVGKDIARGQEDSGPRARVQDNAVPNEDIPSHDKVKKHNNGGSLNGVPFLKKGGRRWILHKPRMIDNTEYTNIDMAEPDKYGRYTRIVREVTPRNNSYRNDTTYWARQYGPGETDYIYSDQGESRGRGRGYGTSIPKDTNVPMDEINKKARQRYYKTPKQVMGGTDYNTWGGYFNYLQERAGKNY